METDHFARLTRAVGRIMPRRAIAGVLGAGTLALPGLAASSKKRQKKVKRNGFGCVNVGKFCQNDGQCCSGMCQGKKGKKRCRAHDSGGCQAGQDICADRDVPCITGIGEAGFCVRTTGNAGYCFASGRCLSPACERDADCQDVCGPQAACIVCEGDCAGSRTVCVGPGEGSCIQP